MAAITLDVEPRVVLGKRVRHLRRAGITPGHVYGHRFESRAVQVKTDQLLRSLRHVARTSLIELRIAGDGQPIHAVVREIARDPATDDLLHIDFQAVSMQEKMRLEVPLAFVGEAPAAAADLTVFHSLSAVEVECLPGDIPQHIQVDVTTLDSPDAMIHVRDLRVPPGVALLTDPALVVARITTGIAAEEVEAAPEEMTEPARVERKRAEGEEAE